MDTMKDTINTLKIPKIIHQIWSGNDNPLPKVFQVLGDTWKRDYPDWEYRLWDDARMSAFVKKYYPEYEEIYSQFPYNIQRWDAIRYLILYRMGGMYVDVDYESIRSIEPLLSGKTCCFSEDPVIHKGNYGEVERYFNNAMMLSTPNHPFMKKIIESVFQETREAYDIHSYDYILKTTGPWKVMDVYYQASEEERQAVYILPKEYVTPFDYYQARRFIKERERSSELENCLKEAYAVHYFFSNWRKQIN